MLDNSFLKKFHVGDEKIVADQLNFGAEFFVNFFQPSQSFSAQPSSMETIGDPAQSDVVIDQFFGRLLCATRFLENVEIFLAVVEFGGSWIERDEDLFAQLVTRLFDRRGNRFQRVFSGIELWRKSTFVANGRGKIPRFQN